MKRLRKLLGNPEVYHPSPQSEPKRPGVSLFSSSRTSNPISPGATIHPGGLPLQARFSNLSGYVASQFKKMQSDIRNHGRVKWKHVMHLIRLLISGIDVLREGKITVDVGDAREKLLTIKRGESSFEEADTWRKRLQVEFEQAYQQTTLPIVPTSNASTRS